MSLIESYLTTKQAADYIGCSVSFIRNMYRRGELRTHRLGAKYYFTKEDLNLVISISSTDDKNATPTLE